MPPPTQELMEAMKREMDGLRGQTRRFVAATLARADLSAAQKFEVLAPILDAARRQAWTVGAGFIELNNEIGRSSPVDLPFLGRRWWDEMLQRAAESIPDALGQTETAVTEASYRGAESAAAPDSKWQLRPTGTACGICVARASTTLDNRPRPTHDRCDCEPVEVPVDEDPDEYTRPYREIYERQIGPEYRERQRDSKGLAKSTQSHIRVDT